MTDNEFWSNRPAAQLVIQEMKQNKMIVEGYHKAEEGVTHISEMAELLEQEGDEELQQELLIDFEKVKQNINQLELKSLLSNPLDGKNAILSIHPGSGGTESQDWAQLLMRMYMRWMEDHGYQAKTLDYQPGEEAGIKSVTIEVAGDYAYGYLKSETGVHRLVRISPFDANKRRHTSFTSVSVIPELDEDLEIDIKDDELRVDTFRASGAGGQHVNRTDSAVRLTHLPSGLVVQCQSERSQHQNKDNAMKILKARLYQIKLDAEHQKRQDLAGEKKDISWGNQIRSYVFMPYTLVKDHRTGAETGNVQAVMDGAIDLFIERFLKLPKESS